MWRSAVTRLRKTTLPLLMVAIGISTCVSALNAQDLSGPFSGRWDLTLKGTTKDLPSWIEVSKDHGSLRWSWWAQPTTLRRSSKLPLRTANLNSFRPKASRVLMPIRRTRPGWLEGDWWGRLRMPTTPGSYLAGAPRSSARQRILSGARLSICSTVKILRDGG